MNRLKFLINNIFYLIGFYGTSLFRGKADKIPESISNILVVQSAKLGDMVCTTPVFRAIKEKYPTSKLTVSCSAINIEVLRGNKNIDNFIDIGRLSVKKIKQNHFDVAFNLNFNFYVSVKLFMANITLIVIPKMEKGNSPFVTKSYKKIIKYFRILGRSIGAHAPQEMLNFLNFIGIKSTNTKKELFFTKEANKKIESMFKDKEFKYVGISLTAGNKIKEWPIDRFVEVADYILEKYKTKVVLIGGPNDKEYSGKFLSTLKEGNKENTIDTTGDLSIDELKALISKLDLYIAVDTGPIYIAEAFDVPTIDIIGPMDEREQPPVSDNNIVLYERGRKESVLHILNARDYDEKEARRQVEAVSVEMVIDAVDTLLPSL